jgi:hypothetical protein
MGVRTALIKRLWVRAQLSACALLAILPCIAAAHPANIPVARAKVQVNGSVELTITFDILAFVLDQTPQIVLDSPMNALVDGPRKDLQDRLAAAQTRFLEGLVIGDEKNLGSVDSVDFPTAEDIHKVIDGGQLPRLPVMMTATVRCHLASHAKRVSFRFAEVLGPVVLTTEFPYKEPTSESIEPGDSSTPLELPTQAEVDALAASMKPKTAIAKKADRKPTEAQARKAIQRQYDAWSKAYMGHDLDTLLSILAPGYTLKTAQGTLIKRNEYEVMLKMRKQKHSDTTLYKTEILRITLKDGVAAIWSRETTTDPGLNQKTGKTEPVSYQHDYIDLWILASGKWLLKGTVTQREQVIAMPKPPRG